MLIASRPRGVRRMDSGSAAFDLAGSLELILEEDGRERVVVLESLNAFVVPRGTWHRARVRAPGKLLGITGGAGTQHRPMAQPRS
jgi:hypothetical protein